MGVNRDPKSSTVPAQPKVSEALTENKAIPGTLTRSFVTEVKNEAIRMAKLPTSNDSEAREQLAAAFTYFFNNILPRDKKQNGLLTRDGNIDPNEVAKLIALFKDNKDDELSAYLTSNPNYKTIINMLRRVKNVEYFEIYLDLKNEIRSLPISIPPPKTAEEIKRIDTFLGNLSSEAIFQNGDLSFMIDALISSIENNYINPNIKMWDDKASTYRGGRFDPFELHPLYKKATMLEQYYNFVELLQQVKKTKTCTPEQVQAILKYQPKLAGKGRTSLMFDHIIRLAKPAHLEENKSYIVKLGTEFNSDWDVHDLHVSAGEPTIDDSTKVHLSFDPSKLETAKKDIIDILEKKHKLHSFKIIHSPVSDGNPTGKEVTIYLQIYNDFKSGAPEKDPNFWINLFNELENALEKIGPNPDFKPQGDKLFPGSKHFIYYRNPENIIKHYIAADDLAGAGFTSTEAADLCPPGHDPIQNFFKEKRLHAGQEVKQAATPSATQDRKLTLELKFPTNLAQLQQKVMDNFRNNMTKDSSEHVFFGDPDYLKQEKIQPFENFAQKLKSAFGYYGEMNKFLKSVLNEAAGYVAKANICLSASGIELPRLDKLGTIDKTGKMITMGNIIPAVYRHFFNPILAEWIKDPNKPFEDIVDKQALIQEIFKCAFRDPKVKQIKLDSPQYYSNLTDNELNQVFKQLAPAERLKTEVAPKRPAVTEVNAVTNTPSVPSRTNAVEVKAEIKTATPEPAKDSVSTVVMPVEKKDQRPLYAVLQQASEQQKKEFLSSIFRILTGFPFQFDEKEGNFRSQEKYLFSSRVTGGSSWVAHEYSEKIIFISDIIGSELQIELTSSKRPEDNSHETKPENVSPDEKKYRTDSFIHPIINGINLNDSKQLEQLCKNLENPQQIRGYNDFNNKYKKHAEDTDQERRDFIAKFKTEHAPKVIASASPAQAPTVPTEVKFQPAQAPTVPTEVKSQVDDFPTTRERAVAIDETSARRHYIQPKRDPRAPSASPKTGTKMAEESSSHKNPFRKF